MKKFSEYRFKSYINQALEKIGFYEATPIQELTIDRALKKESLVVESATGSGKTHAFLLPVFQKLDESNQSVQAVIISPTRELASQLYEVAMEIASCSEQEIFIMKAIGGNDREKEINRLQKNQPHIVIGTIGRIVDLAINSNVLKIHNAEMIVIDEADMVFSHKELLEVDKIMGKIQGEPQFLIFSATIPKGLRQFLNKYLENVQAITIEETNLTTGNIEHYMLQCKAKKKDEVLLQLLEIINPYLAIIFVNTKEEVERLSMYLAEQGFKVGKMHGSMEDRSRKQMLKRINNLEFKYVVASDIVARGIDIEGVSHVINYDLPKDIEFYIHRTGRTARFTNTGVAYSLYAYEDDSYIKLLQSKGLKPKFVKITNGNIVEVKFFVKKELTVSQQIENKVHREIPLPKKVKPGYKKKRNEQIKKKIKQEKRARISEMYRKKAQKERRNENR